MSTRATMIRAPRPASAHPSAGVEHERSRPHRARAHRFGRCSRSGCGPQDGAANGVEAYAGGAGRHATGHARGVSAAAGGRCRLLAVLFQPRSSTQAAETVKRFVRPLRDRGGDYAVRNATRAAEPDRRGSAGCAGSGTSSRRWLLGRYVPCLSEAAMLDAHEQAFVLRWPHPAGGRSAHRVGRRRAVEHDVQVRRLLRPRLCRAYRAQRGRSRRAISWRAGGSATTSISTSSWRDGGRRVRRAADRWRAGRSGSTPLTWTDYLVTVDTNRYSTLIGQPVEVLRHDGCLR